MKRKNQVRYILSTRILSIVMALIMALGTFQLTIQPASAAAASNLTLWVVDKAGAYQQVGTWTYDSTNKTYKNGGTEASFITTYDNSTYLRYSGKDSSVYSRMAVCTKGILLSDLKSYASTTSGIPLDNNTIVTWSKATTGKSYSSYLNRYYYPSYIENQTFNDTGKAAVPAVLAILSYNQRNLAGSTNDGWGSATALTALNGGIEVPVADNETSLEYAFNILRQGANDVNSLRIILGQNASSNDKNLGSLSWSNIDNITFSPVYLGISTKVTNPDNSSATATITTDDGYLKAAAGEAVSFTIDNITSGYGIDNVSVSDSSGNTVNISETDNTYSFTMPDSAATITASLEIIWDGSVNTSWYNTSDTSFSLSTPAQLAGLAAIVNGTATGITQDSFYGKTISLNSNIQLDEDNLYTSADVYFQDGSANYSGTFSVPTIDAGANIWTPIGNSTYAFKGTFNGCDKTVNGLYTSVTASCQGLFGYLGQGAAVENITVSGVVAGVQYIGGIAGIVNGASITNAVNYAVIYATGNAPGGSGTASGTGTGYAGHLGGIAGLGTGTASYPVTITGCANYGSVTCPNCNHGGRAGGIVGIFDNSTDYATISECFNTAAIDSYQYVGGIVGGQFSTAVTISKCYNTGLITGTSSGKTYVGGITGTSCGPIANSYNTGNVVSTATSGNQPTRFAGISGETSGSPATIINGYNIGQVSGAVALGTSGNIVGSQSVSPVNCYYLSTTSLSSAGDSSTTTSKTEAEMKATSMPAILGTAYALDSNNYNNGYPVLAWQNGQSENVTTNAISLSYDNTIATVSSSDSEAASGDTVTITVSNITSGKQVYCVTVSDSYSTAYSVTTETANQTYSFTMGSYPVTVTVLFENTSNGGTAYAYTIDSSLDPIWTVDVTSSGRTNNTITAGSTVMVTVSRTSDAITASLNGPVIEDNSTSAVSYSTIATSSGGYNTIKGGVYSFTMPESAVTIGLDVTYTGLSVYQQYGTDGTPILIKTYSRDQMIALSGANPIYYTGYDKTPTAVIGKAAQPVKLTDLMSDAGLSFSAGDSIRLDAMDESNRTYTYENLYGVNRYYYPNIASASNQAEGKTLLDSMLVIKGYQQRFMDFASGETIDNMTCDSLYAYRFIYGQTEAQFNDGIATADNATVNDFLKYVDTLTLIVPEKAEAWDGSVDVSWYNTSDTEFYISTPAQMAGLAAIVNGHLDADAGTVTGSFTQSDNYSTSIDNFKGKIIYLTADLDMGGVETDAVWSGPNYTPIGGQWCTETDNASTLLEISFNGTLDGQGHTVKNIYCDRYNSSDYKKSQSIGLVGRLGCSDTDATSLYPDNPTVRNVAVTGYIYGRRSVGGIVGKIGKTKYGGLIQNCANFATINGTDTKGTGGICGSGWNGGTISNCYNAGDVSNTGSNVTGGIVGSNEDNITNCYNIGNISAGSSSYAMAIGSHNSGTYTVSNCYWLTDSAPGGGYFKGSNIQVTEENETYMQSADFLTTLNGSGSAFVMDTANLNNGYPILSWQTGKTTEVSISPASQTVTGGTTFNVEVAIETGTASRGWQLDVSFDPDLLTANSVTEGGFLSDWADNNSCSTASVGQLAIDNTTGTISNVGYFIQGTTTGGPSGSGTLCTIAFTAKNVSGTSAVSLENVVVSDSETIPQHIDNVTTTDGEVYVSAFSTADLILTPSTDNAAVGETFDVDIQAQSGDTEIVGLDAYLDFDYTKLAVVSITDGSTLTTDIQSSADNSTGHIDYSAGLFNSTSSGTFTVATVRFKALAVSSGTAVTFSTSYTRPTFISGVNGVNVTGSLTGGSYTIVSGVDVETSVVLQGSRPDTGWIVPLTVNFFTPGASVLTATPLYTFTENTTKDGSTAVITCANIALGTYDISAVSSHTLVNVVKNVVIDASATSLSLGTLLEGNANNDLRINIADFSILSGAYGTASTNSAYNALADFDRSGNINIADFSLLSSNYTKISPITVK